MSSIYNFSAQKPSRRPPVGAQNRQQRHSEGCDADAKALTAAVAAEAIPSIQARCQAGPVETRADTFRVRAASAETQT